MTAVNSSASKHVVLLAFQFPPVNSPGVQRALRLWKYLPERGYTTHVVCSGYTGVQEMRNTTHVPNARTRSAVGAREWVASFVQRLLPHNERLPWVPHAVAAASEIFERVPVSAVISTSPPIATHIAAMKLKKKYGAVWVADFRDSLTTNPFRKRDWSQFYEPKVEHAIFERADVLTASTDRIREEWREKYPSLSSKMHVVWNGFDPEEPFGPAPIPTRPYRVLVYTGRLYGGRHPGILLDSFARLISSGRVDPKQIRIQLVGPIDEMAAFRALPSVQSLSSQGCLHATGELLPRPQALQILSEADYLLLIDNNSFNLGHTVPAKLFEYVRIGRPILALVPDGSIVERILSQSGVPHVCIRQEEPPASLDEKVERFLRIPSDAVNPSDWFREQFDGRHQTLHLAELMDASVRRGSEVLAGR